jgi:hypothetical protein
VPATVPLRLAFHVIVRCTDAPVVDSVAQLNGLDANDPLPLALLMVMALVLVRQAENLALTVEGLVPPPDLVRGGENDNLADTEQVTDPEAGPENLAALAPWAPTVWADADDAIANMTTTTANMAAQDDKRAVEGARECTRTLGRWVMAHSRLEPVRSAERNAASRFRPP